MLSMALRVSTLLLMTGIGMLTILAGAAVGDLGLVFLPDDGRLPVEQAPASGDPDILRDAASVLGWSGLLLISGSLYLLWQSLRFRVPA